MSTIQKEQLKAVIVGHVDHGKSTIIGRLLADTNVLPKGKLEHVKKMCEKNSKPFEYAFLLDALKDEQSQGITIDSARCFFKTNHRNYIIMDAPGHKEFIRNMVTGAAQAEAAFIVLDAKEGIQENTKRHAYLVSMLGIKQVVVLVNKMDLVDYDKSRFDAIKKEYKEFLEQFHILPINYIPISGRNGINISTNSGLIHWYKGKSFLEELEDLKKPKSNEDLPFRFCVHDIYKFTRNNDDRRIYAGIVETGSINVGDEIVFFPSLKQSFIKTIERFNALNTSFANAGDSVGFTIQDEYYVSPGEIMVKTKEKKPLTGTLFKANMFWLGNVPMFQDKEYKLKIGTNKTGVYLKKVINVLDASELTIENERRLIQKNEIAEVILETTNPVSFDLIHEIESSARFVIVDEYDIAGGGIILEKQNESLPSDSSKEKNISSSNSFENKVDKTKIKKIAHSDSHLRSIIKAISWRFFAFIITLIIGWGLTGKITFGIAIGLTDSFIKIIFYYTHERLWEKVHFGRKNLSVFQGGGI